MKLNAFLALVIATVSLGCATALSTKGTQVLLVGPELKAEVLGCKKGPIVRAWGASDELNELRILLRNQAGDLGANVVLTDSKLEAPDYLTYGRVSFSEMLGQTYFCSQKELAKIKPAPEVKTK